MDLRGLTPPKRKLSHEPHVDCEGLARGGHPVDRCAASRSARDHDARRSPSSVMKGVPSLQSARAVTRAASLAAGAAGGVAAGANSIQSVVCFERLQRAVSELNRRRIAPSSTWLHSGIRTRHPQRKRLLLYQMSYMRKLGHQPIGGEDTSSVGIRFSSGAAPAGELDARP